jgi:hypothetical protein
VGSRTALKPASESPEAVEAACLFGSWLSRQRRLDPLNRPHAHAVELGQLDNPQASGPENGLFEGELTDDNQLVYVNDVNKKKMLASEELRTQAILVC